MWTLTRHVDAVPLSDLVRPGNVIVGALLDDLVLAVIERLAVLHGLERPVIHRDVTPANLMLSFDGPALSVHLIDYEAACFADGRQTPVGAAGFAPPEQIRGEAVLSSDLYSLLATAFFLATAELPPNLARSSETPVAFPSGVWGSMTRLDERYGHRNLVRCWALDPRERPLSARHFLAKVEVPGTRLWTDVKPLGVFECGRQCRVTLTDRSYSVERESGA
jgi:serine/threonine protein kinase